MTQNEGHGEAVIQQAGQPPHVVSLRGCSFGGSFALDDAWRSLDYRAGDSALQLRLAGTLVPTPQQVRALPQLFSADVGPGETPLLTLELEVNHTQMDAPRSFRSVPIDALPLFPSAAEFVDYTANGPVCAQSGFWFGPVATLAVVSSIRVSGGAASTVVIEGRAADTASDLAFTLTFRDLPFTVEVRAPAGPKPSARVAQREDIIACFGALYDIDAYTVTDEDVGDDVVVRFVAKR